MCDAQAASDRPATGPRQAATGPGRLLQVPSCGKTPAGSLTDMRTDRGARESPCGAALRSGTADTPPGSPPASPLLQAELLRAPCWHALGCRHAETSTRINRYNLSGALLSTALPSVFKINRIERVQFLIRVGEKSQSLDANQQIAIIQHELESE